MAEFGINPEGFVLKRLPDIQSDLNDRVAAALNNESSLLPDSPEGQLIGLFSILYSQLWEELELAYSAFNPQAVTDQNLRNLVQLNGLTELTKRPSTVVLEATGVPGTVIPANSIVSNALTQTQWLTDADANIPSTGIVELTGRSKDFGVIAANVDEITVIESPVNGWSEITNTEAAVVGRLDETDSELRVRRQRSLSLSGQSSLGSIFSSVGAVGGVSYVSVTENVTDSIQPLTNLPPHSFSVVVRGGDDQSIADTIWNKKPVGILSYGDVDVPVKDTQGDTHIISFQRPIGVNIYVQANLTFFSGAIPDDVETLLGQAIIDYAEGRLVPGAGFEVGDDIIHSRLYTPLNITIQGHTVNTLEISFDGVSWVTSDLTIQFNEVGIFDLTRISIAAG